MLTDWCGCPVELSPNKDEIGFSQQFLIFDIVSNDLYTCETKKNTRDALKNTRTANSCEEE